MKADFRRDVASAIQIVRPPYRYYRPYPYYSYYSGPSYYWSNGHRITDTTGTITTTDTKLT
jgi:hypothetical protein